MSTTNIETIRINEIEYVRKDSIPTIPQVSDDDYVIVRSRDQGVMCGYLKSIDGRQVVITQSRQLWSWNSKALALPDIALHGLRGEAKISAASPKTTFLEACGVLACTPAAACSLQTHPVDKVAQ